MKQKKLQKRLLKKPNRFQSKRVYGMRKAVIQNTGSFYSTRWDCNLIISKGNIGGKLAHEQKGEVEIV